MQAVGFADLEMHMMGGAVWTPALLPSLAQWLDGADTATIAANPDDTITTWSDKSGKGVHAADYLGEATPKTGQTTKNGRNVVSFSPTVFEALTCWDKYIFSLTGINVTIACRPTRATDSVLTFAWDFGAVAFAGYGMVVSTARLVGYVGKNTSNYEVLDTAGTYVAAIYELDIVCSDRIYTRVNGVSIADAAIAFMTQITATEINEGTTPSTEHNDGPVTIGAQSKGTNRPTRFFGGEMYEIVVCDAPMSTDDRTSLNAYLAAKWGI